MAPLSALHHIAFPSPSSIHAQCPLCWPPMVFYWQGASRHHISITYGIQPEAEYKYFPEEKLPGCHGGYAKDEEHYTLHDLSVVELTKAADEG
jgi:hypothetical protein